MSDIHQPGTAKHGEYRPGMGFYDSSLRGWIKDPAKLTEVTPVREVTQAQRDEYARMQAKSSGAFKTDPQKEAMIRLRDSDRQEEREKFNRMFSGTQRAALGSYEDQKREADNA